MVLQCKTGSWVLLLCIFVTLLCMPGTAFQGLHLILTRIAARPLAGHTAWTQGACIFVWYSSGSAVVQVKSGYVAGGRTPSTALHGNMRTPATGARQTPASNSGRPAQNPLNTVAAATTRPSRFMQGAARGGRPAGQQAAPDDTPVVPARPARGPRVVSVPPPP